MAKYDNPFFYNYLFSQEDVSRIKIKWWQYPLLWILPTYVQINDGHAFFFKQWGNQYFYIREEKIPSLPQDTSADVST